MSSIFAVTKALTNVYDVLAKKGTTREDLDSLADFRCCLNCIIWTERGSTLHYEWADGQRVHSREGGCRILIFCLELRCTEAIACTYLVRSTFNSYLNKEEKYQIMERLTSPEKDAKLTVRVRAPGKPI